MKIICLLCLWLVLTGCSTAPVWERVEDEMPALPVSVWQEQTYDIQVGLPDGASLTWERETGRLYEADHLEIETSVFLTSSAESAVRQLSGYDMEQMTLVETSRFGMPEYQFAWYAQTEEGGQLCRADLLLDGTVCYAVVCRSPEGEGKWLQEQSQQVFSSFGLSVKESV